LRVVALAFLGLACSTDAGIVLAQSARIPAATTGITRALVVFVRFSDDQRHETGCRANRGWPLQGDREELPAYAHTLFANDPSPPFPDSSATAYFYHQSNGRLVLLGDVYPTIVESRHGAAYYRSAEGRGYGYLTAEVLESIDPEIDFAAYDTNPVDGVVDQIFLIIRRDDAGTFTGVASLAGADRVRGRPDRELVFDGVRVEWESSGSIIYHHRPGHIISQSYMTRMIAHEFGHHIWNPRRFFPQHVPAIRTNQIPANDTRVIGYTLMAGRGGGIDARGDLLISSPERDAVGWLDPFVLNPARDSLQQIVLHDLYETGEAVRVDVKSSEGPDRVSIYLANRQRKGWFDQYRLDAPPGCPAFEMGLLRTTGLLVMLTDWRKGRFYLDVLPADNTLNLSIENATYEGDLFGSPENSQITPFTEPSTALPDGTPTWFAIDDIRPAGDDGSMELTFVPDFRTRTIIRRDSRISPSLGPVVLANDLRLTGSTTLTLEPGGRLEIKGDMYVDPGSELLARAGSVLVVRGSARHVLTDTAFVQSITWTE
jgi:M6 family metalloprotease-like protein